ncbi:MAG TPA: hypothetical protein VEI83_14315 [Acidimicrobiales bacterium]|nr:hypothetical protein [Acidimicrobiales bacterium]
MTDTATFTYVPHERTTAHEAGTLPGPVRVRDQRRIHHPNPVIRFNARFGLFVTVIVGTMWCAYIFTGIALISLPSAITSHNLTIIIAWISSNFLQLVLLPIIIVGQNIQAQAADKRSEQTYKDAEAVLHEALQIQQHLEAQDKVLSDLVAKVAALGAAG